MMQNVNSESLVLPLIARSVTSPQSALLATTSEGADFLLVQTQQDDLANIISTVSGRVSIPVFSQESMSSVSLGGTCFKSLEAGATGIVYNAIDLKSLTADQRRTLTSSLLDAMTRAQSKAADISRSAVNDLQELSDLGTARKPSSMEKKSLDLQVMEILDEERSVLESLIILMKEAYPEVGHSAFVNSKSNIYVFESIESNAICQDGHVYHGLTVLSFHTTQIFSAFHKAVLGTREYG